MADSIYNFFNFLEKKAGKTLSPDKNFLMKLAHAKELVSKEDADDLSFDMQLTYFPEMFDDANVTISGDSSVGDASVYKQDKVSPGCQGFSVLQNPPFTRPANNIGIMDFPVPGGPCKYTTQCLCAL